MVEILFYGDASVEPWNTICDHKTDNLPSQMTIFNTIIPILILFFTFSPVKLLYFAQQESVASDIKPHVSQWKVTLHNDVGFSTVNLRIYHRKYLQLYPISHRVIFTSAFECCIIGVQEKCMKNMKGLIHSSAAEQQNKIIYISKKIYTKF